MKRTCEILCNLPHILPEYGAENIFLYADTCSQRVSVGRFAWLLGVRAYRPRRSGSCSHTTAPAGIYDADNRGTGGSNTKEVRHVLQDLGLVPPLRLQQEAIDFNWSGESRVHRSSFFHPVNAVLSLGRPPFTNEVDYKRWKAVYELADDKLISFMGYVASHVTSTKFLVYSRGTDPQWTNDVWRTQTWTQAIEGRFPELKGRVTTMVIPHGYHGTFRDPETRELLGSNVRAILKLPKKDK